MKIFIAFLFVSLSVHALTYEQRAVDAALAGAELQAVIHVDSIQNRISPDGVAQQRSSATVSRVERTTSRELPVAGESITVVTGGGEINGVGVFISGFPRPRVGGQYRAYLSRTNEPNEFQIVGFERGLEPLNFTRNYSRNRTDGSNGTGNGPFLYWDPSYFPIPYYISALSFRTHPEYVAAIDASFQTWRAPGEILTDFLAMGCSSVTRNENDGMNNIIFISKDWPYDTAAIAVTRNFYISNSGARGGLILDSDILINGVDHQFSVTGETGKHDLRNIVTHEIGHFLGMGHEAVPKDVTASMYEVANAGETNKRNLGTNDLAGIRAAYPGAGRKIGSTTTLCSIPGSALNCMAVGGKTDAASNALPFLFLLFFVYLVRRAFPALRSRS